MDMYHEVTVAFDVNQIPLLVALASHFFILSILYFNSKLRFEYEVASNHLILLSYKTLDSFY